MKTRAFDQPEAIDLAQSERAFLETFLPGLVKEKHITTALDAGCGYGFFSRYLRGLGLQVTGIDGRPEHIAEAAARNPELEFKAHDLENPSLAGLGVFDLVLCFGVLDHLENPFRAVRNLFALSTKHLIIETQVARHRALIGVLCEEPHSIDQSLNYTAVIPTESCLVKMLYKAGFRSVYRPNQLPGHADFHRSLTRRKLRTILVASKEQFHHPDFHFAVEPPAGALSAGLRNFGDLVRNPKRALRRLWLLRSRFSPLNLPVPCRLPFGGWWLAYGDAMGLAVFRGHYNEEAEWHFVARFLKPGMTVFDIGAHHGFYTLLASRKVGPDGRVIAFEPSPRERRKLLRHLRLNRCANVQVEACALGSKQGEADLFVVDGVETGCNSLRPPNVAEPTRRVPVSVLTLDRCLQREKMQKVDFIKLDVEGAEIEVLKGAEQLLARQPRPVFLCEVQDIRTAPWGYPAGEIIDFLRRRGFHWFVPAADGGLEALPPDQTRFDGNFLAVPEERLPEVERFSQQPSEDRAVYALA